MGKPSLQDTLEFENDNDNDKYLIENLTTLGPLHSMLCKGIEFTSKNQFPVVEPYTGELPENLCSIHRLRKKPDSLLRILCAHFFTDDSNIEPYWNKPFKYLSMLDILKPIHIMRYGAYIEGERKEMSIQLSLTQ